MAVVFTFVLCQALHSDRKGKFPVFLRKNSIAYESMGRRLIQLPIIILYPLHVLEVEVLVYFINVIPWGEGLPVKRKQSKIPNTVTVILPLSKPSNLQIPGRKKALICLYENR